MKKQLAMLLSLVMLFLCGCSAEGAPGGTPTTTAVQNDKGTTTSTTTAVQTTTTTASDGIDEENLVTDAQVTTTQAPTTTKKQPSTVAGVTTTTTTITITPSAPTTGVKTTAKRTAKTTTARVQVKVHNAGDVYKTELLFKAEGIGKVVDAQYYNDAYYLKTENGKIYYTVPGKTFSDGSILKEAPEDCGVSFGDRSDAVWQWTDGKYYFSDYGVSGPGYINYSSPVLMPKDEGYVDSWWISRGRFLLRTTGGYYYSTGTIVTNQEQQGYIDSPPPEYAWAVKPISGFPDDYIAVVSSQAYQADTVDILKADNCIYRLTIAWYDIYEYR